MRVAAETGIPLTLLRALARTETGRMRDGVFGPWPWTVNNAGDGRWFDNLADALTHAERRRAQGATNLDIGCFQINLRWHGHAFASLRDMFDPMQNTRYAARFLTRLYREFGTWDAAVAAFHSRTPHFAARYMDRYTRIHAALVANGDSVTTEQTLPATRSPRRAVTRASALDTGRRPSLLPDRAGATSATGPGLIGRGVARPLWEGPP